MGFMDNIFGFKSKKEEISVEYLNKLLFNTFEENLLESIDSYNDILESKGNIDEKNFYLVFGAVESLILAKVKSAKGIKSKGKEKELKALTELNANIITYKYAERYNIAMKEEEKIFNKIMKVRNQLHSAYKNNINSEPAPNWYQAKTLVKLLYNPNNPEKVDKSKYQRPVVIQYFSEVIHNKLMNKKDLIEDILEKFDLVLN